MASILVVDDDPLLLETIEGWLKFERHAVTVVGAGPAGWDYLEKNEYDLVVLDWDLPGLSGMDILRRLRAAGKVTKVIMLTGHSAIDDKESGLDAGADDYVTKPFHMKELCARIRAALRTTADAPLGHGNEAILAHGDLAGTKLAASWEFLELLGEGSTAVVFKARHPRSDRLVAIKVLLSTALKPTAIMRFEREARAISRINHYNVVTVYDCGVTEENRPYIVMEYINGQSLLEKIESEGPLSLDQVCAILIQTCKGLQEAHCKGIIHRDMKPENILLQKRSDRDDWVKIVDFGLAQFLDGDQARITGNDRVAGTPLFVAPERLLKHPADARSDIYSLGVTMFEMLTGRQLFDEESMELIMLKSFMNMPEPPSRYRQDIPEDSAFDRVFLKATAKDPNLRYQSASEMTVELEQIYSRLSARLHDSQD